MRLEVSKKAIRKRRTAATLQTSYTTAGGEAKTVQRKLVLTKAR